MNIRPYAAEFIGTFALALVVSLGVVGQPIYPVAYIAAVTVAIFVYAIGPISGAHLNPAVTIGLLSVRRIGVADAVYYLVAQMLAAGAAMIVCSLLMGEAASVVTVETTVRVALAEAIGAFLLVWTISAVVEKKIHAAASGFAIGSSLLIGILLAAAIGSNAVLNPAVAFALSTLNLAYLAGPIVGGIAGAWAYRAVSEKSA